MHVYVICREQHQCNLSLYRVFSTITTLYILSSQFTTRTFKHRIIYRYYNSYSKDDACMFHHVKHSTENLLLLLNKLLPALRLTRTGWPKPKKWIIHGAFVYQNNQRTRLELKGDTNMPLMSILFASTRVHWKGMTEAQSDETTDEGGRDEVDGACTFGWGSPAAGARGP
jgi:hypothetical protein